MFDVIANEEFTYASEREWYLTTATTTVGLHVLSNLECTAINKAGPQQLARVAALWEAVYCDELGWLKPDESSAAICDRYHQAAEYFVLSAAHGTKRHDVATARVVFDSALGLPVDQHADLSSARRKGPIAEVQRMMVLPGLRRRRIPGAPFGIMAALLRAVLHLALQRRCRSIVLNAFDDARASPVRAFGAMGFVRVGQPFHDHELDSEIPSVAMALDLQHAMRASRAQPQRPFVAYMLELEDCPWSDAEITQLRASARDPSTARR